MNETKKNNDDSGKKTEDKKSVTIIWFAVLFYLYIHSFGVFGIYYLFTSAKWLTLLYFVFLITISSLGLTIGAHRLYAHQTFEATWQLRFFFVLMHTLSGVGTLYNWVFWHRMHHKYYGTDRDPYNHKKGFLYSHVFSNVLAPPFDMQMCQQDIDMRDVDADGFVWIQRKFYWLIFPIFGILLPMNVPMQLWDESFLNVFLIIGAARLMITVNTAWLVNSALLVWGLNKGDKYPLDDNSVFFLSKSYWLNYHYVIPWDWKNDEFGQYNNGFATFILKMLYELGLVNKMKTTSSEEIREALHKIALSKMTLNEVLEELKNNAEDVAHRKNLIYHH